MNLEEKARQVAEELYEQRYGRKVRSSADRRYVQFAADVVAAFVRSQWVNVDETDKLIKRIEDYRSGYTCGYSDAKNGTRVRDKDAAEIFFNIEGGTIPDVSASDPWYPWRYNKVLDCWVCIDCGSLSGHSKDCPRKPVAPAPQSEEAE